jgi:hypothetical protein
MKLRIGKNISYSRFKPCGKEYTVKNTLSINLTLFQTQTPHFTFSFLIFEARPIGKWKKPPKKSA